MVPTLVGISAILWLVMLAAPGRPGGKTQEFGEAKVDVDPSKELAKGESQYIFRRQYALDRPAFLNTWTSLDDAVVLASVDDERAPIETVGAKRKREARERLEDWGTYAVPALVHALRTTTGERQDAVLRWLRLSATRRTTPGEDAETVRRNDEIIAENHETEKWKWKAGAATAERSAAVEAWEKWF